MTEIRRSPGGGAGATPKHRANKRRANGYHHSSGDYRHEAPTADERREQKLVDELHELGYGITVPRLECGHPLTSPASLARHIGPVCAAKAAAK